VNWWEAQWRQLNRAMAWVCVGISSNNNIGGGSSRVIGIPTEFHEHIWWQK